MSNISISVVIPAYNCGKYLERAVNSVLMQTSAADEIIVVDDGSTDDTAEIAKIFGDKIRFLTQKNSGASVARNTGIEASMYDWVAFLDGDDQWLETKLEKQRELLSKQPMLRWCTANCYHIKNGVKQIYDDSIKVGSVVKDGCFNYLKGYQIAVTGHTDTMLISRSFLYEAGLFTPGQKRINDEDLWLRLAYLDPVIGYVNEPLALYYDVPDSITKKHLDAHVLENLIDRHVDIISGEQCQKDGELCLRRMVKTWCWSFLHSGQTCNVRHLLFKYRNLLNTEFIVKTFLGSFMPVFYLKLQQRKKS